MDVRRIACMLVDTALAAFDARGAAVYLQTDRQGEALQCRGHMNGDPTIEVSLRHDGLAMGRLVLGTRRVTPRTADETVRHSSGRPIRWVRRSRLPRITATGPGYLYGQSLLRPFRYGGSRLSWIDRPAGRSATPRGAPPGTRAPV